jgi:hypothetical protein
MQVPIWWLAPAPDNAYHQQHLYPVTSESMHSAVVFYMHKGATHTAPVLCLHQNQGVTC